MIRPVTALAATVSGEPAEYLSKLEALYKKQGVVLEYVEAIGGGALGRRGGGG